MDEIDNIRMPTENTHLFSSKIRDALGKTDGVNVGNNNIESKQSRIEYLRNKYGKLTSEEIHSRINLRSINQEAINQG
ncbi:hypothetical protein QGM71_16875 [Virgibacillus sp. C22-A2]|uniref:Uncharacterized protein n=1 Tax=Virgibacillus tibetensis TaxID=3042313 RepID=A0ABU6KL50_9BACI|nr:hypothetical protein [Virgibacillus sp. C22-A2]